MILSTLTAMAKSAVIAVEKALLAADSTIRHELAELGAKLPHVTMILLQDGTVMMRGNCGLEELSEFGEALRKIDRAHAQSTSAGQSVVRIRARG